MYIATDVCHNAIGVPIYRRDGEREMRDLRFLLRKLHSGHNQEHYVIL